MLSIRKHKKNCKCKSKRLRKSKHKKSVKKQTGGFRYGNAHTGDVLLSASSEPKSRSKTRTKTRSKTRSKSRSKKHHHRRF